MRGWRGTSVDSAQELGRIVTAERDRIVRLWAKRMRAELHEIDLPGRDLRRPLERIVAELGRLLRERGDEAVWMFGEAIRHHGIRRFEQRFDPEDVAREMASLHGVILRVVARETGGIAPAIAELLAAVIGEAAGAVLAAYTRALRTEEVRFREAAAMESVLRHLEVGIVLVDADGTVVFSTPSVTRLVGLPARALVGAKAAEALRLVLLQVHARHPGGEPFRPSDMPYVRALEEKHSVEGVRVAIDRYPGGEEAILEMNATPLVDDATGEPYGVIQTLTDRTQLVRRERQQQELVRHATDTALALNNSLNVLRLKLDLLRKEGAPAVQPHLDEVEKALKGAADRVRTLQDPARPAPEAPATVPAPPPPLPEPPGARALRGEARKVLVVDDDIENASVMAEVLAEEGYTVRVATNGMQAKELWRHEVFDAALLDAVMPGMSGWQLARVLRDTCPQAVVGIVTGGDVRNIRRQDLEQVDAVFRKPVDAATLDRFLSGEASP